MLKCYKMIVKEHSHDYVRELVDIKASYINELHEKGLIEGETVEQLTVDYNRACQTLNEKLILKARNKLERAVIDRKYDTLLKSLEGKASFLAVDDTPEKVKQNIENTLALLIRKSLIEKPEGHNRIAKEHYWMTEVSTVPKIIATIREGILSGYVVIPEEKGIGDFIITHIRDKKGLDLRKAVEKALMREKNCDNSRQIATSYLQTKNNS